MKIAFIFCRTSCIFSRNCQEISVIDRRPEWKNDIPVCIVALDVMHSESDAAQACIQLNHGRRRRQQLCPAYAGCKPGHRSLSCCPYLHLEASQTIGNVQNGESNRGRYLFKDFFRDRRNTSPDFGFLKSLWGGPYFNFVSM